MVTQLVGVQSPFRAVAEYPPLLPYVGQNDCYHRLADFAESMLAEEQAHFFAIYGDWAMGKSRLAHELVAQVCGTSQGWLLSDGTRAAPLLRPLAEGGALVPLFISFLDVLKFQGEFGLDTRTAIGKITCAAAAYLASQGRARSSHYTLLLALRNAVSAINPNFDFDRLSDLANDPSRSFPERATAIRDLFGTQTHGQVTRLLVVVDEVESAGEVNPFAEEIMREVADRPIPLRAVRDLYESVKEAVNTNIYTGLNFLLFNTNVSRRVAQMDALDRRMITADLEKATAADLDQLLRAVRETGYPMEGLLRDLGQRAFFAADRNLGWFSFIMHKAHTELASKPDQSIGQVFAGVYQRTGKVFQPRCFEDRDIAPPALKDAMGRLIYNQIPATLAELDIPATLAALLLAYQDPFQTRFIGEAAVVEVSADQLTKGLLGITDAHGTNLYISEDRPRLTGEGSVKFDPANLLASLGTFTWERENDPRGAGIRLWIYTDPADFQNQVQFAYRGFGENLAAGTVRTIHRLLLERYTQPQPEPLFAPTMALLQRFNDLWGKAAANNWLRENEKWEGLITAVEQAPQHNDERLLRGVANVLFDAPEEVKPSPYATIRAPYLTLKVEFYESLNVTSRNQLVLLKAQETPNGVMDDLRAINQRVPVLLLFSRASDRDRWQQHVRENHGEHLAIGVTPHVVEPHTREWEFYVRYALRDQSEAGGFKSSDVNNIGKELRAEFKEMLTEAFQSWLKRAEELGYVLRAFYPAITANAPGFREFATYWRKLLMAGSLSALGAESQATAKALEDYERERGDGILTLTGGEGAARHAVIPPIVPRLLEALTIKPRKLVELESEIFYARPTKQMTTPARGAGVLEQLMTLLEMLGVVERDTEARYQVRSAQAIAARFDDAFFRLGTFDGTGSGYAREVSALSAPIQRVATQLEVDESHLKVLKTQHLTPRKEELAGLPLLALTALPPETGAYAMVAREIGAITEVLDRVLGKPGQAQQPPAIDPGTLRDNITSIATDTAYHEYSIEYRVTFLKQLDAYLADEERAVRSELAAKRELVAREGAAGGFPTQPLLELFSQVQQDLEDRLPGDVLPLALRQPTNNLPLTLKTLKGAKLADALVKVNWYRAQLDEVTPDGWWKQYLAARDAWERAREAHERTRSVWAALEGYFKGTAEEHRNNFTGPSLLREVVQLNEDDTSFVATNDTPTTTLAQLRQEIDAIGEKSATIQQLIETARQRAVKEIDHLLAGTHIDVVRHLADRKQSAMPLPNDQPVRDARTHEDAHRKLQQFTDEVNQAGVSLCGDENLFKVYLDLTHDVHQRQMSDDELVARYRKEVLDQMQKRDLLTLRMVIEL